MKQFNWILLISIFLFGQTKVWSQAEMEVKVKTKEGIVYGTLALVNHKKKPTIAIIIPGSGAPDRNGNGGVLQSNSYKMLSDGLVGRGIACLRYDKLGVGKSTTKIEERDMRFEDNVIPVVAWIDYLTKKGYKDIILIGHSEGSLIGLLATEERKVSGFISLEGAGRTIDKLILEQISNLSPNDSTECKEVLAKLKDGKEVSKYSPQLASLFRINIQPYLISWIKYDPKEEISKLDIPIFIVQGTTDLQVTEKDAELLREGNPKAKFIILTGMNHILKSAPKERDKNTNTYYDPYLPLHTGLIPAILKFTDQRKVTDRDKKKEKEIEQEGGP